MILNWEHMLSCKISSLSPAAKLHIVIEAVAAQSLSNTGSFAMWKFTLDKLKLLTQSN